MTQLMEAMNTYREAFENVEQELAGFGPGWLHEIRTEALESFEQRGFPTLRQEEWRFTNVAPIARTPFILADHGQQAGASLPHAAAFDAHRLVFVNGQLVPELGDVKSLPGGVKLAGLAEVLAESPQSIEPYLTRHADWRSHSFTALNTAFLRDGAVLVIPRGLVIERPIHLVFLSTAQADPRMSHPRTLIVAGDNSQSTIVESYVGMNEGLYFTNALTEVVAGENAVLDHYKVQQEGTEAFHVATLQVFQKRSSNCSFLSAALGGALVRNEVNVVHGGEGCETTLNGLSLATGTQLIDNHTVIEHAKPHCASHELYKAILDDGAHGVFSGKIHVHPDAQKTDAKQTNQTLLLSDGAVINTKPQLEIYADDVKCTHGATVGQLDPEAIYYLQTRGIGRADAVGLLTYAFANEIVSRIRLEPLRARVEKELARRLRRTRPEAAQ